MEGRGLPDKVNRVSAINTLKKLSEGLGAMESQLGLSGLVWSKFCSSKSMNTLAWDENMWVPMVELSEKWLCVRRN